MARTTSEGQHDVERVQLEEVAVRLAGRRAGPAVADLAEVVAALGRAPQLLERFSLGEVLRQRGQRGRQIEEHPMHPRAGGRVGVVDDEREGLGRGRRPAPGELRREIGPVTGVLDGNRRARGERGAGEGERHRCLRRATGRDQSRDHEFHNVAFKPCRQPRGQLGARVRRHHLDARRVAAPPDADPDDAGQAHQRVAVSGEDLGDGARGRGLLRRGERPQRRGPQRQDRGASRRHP